MKKFIFGITLSLLVWFPINAEAYRSSVDKAYSDNIRQGDGKIVISTTDHDVDVSKGVVDDESAVNVFGLAPTGVQTTATDIWDRADATPTQQIYIMPTTARIHNIKSGSASDDGDPVGVGARIVRVYGLQNWSVSQTTEDIILNGTTDVATVNSYVFINKLEVLTMGALNTNVGAITATAITDATISAVILASQGISKNAIYGFSSFDTLYVKDWYGSINGTDTGHMAMELLVNSIPDIGGTNTAFRKLNKRGLQATGTSSGVWTFNPPFKIEGPAVVKIQATASIGDVEGGAGINGIIIADSTTFRILVTSGRTMRVLTTTAGRILRTTQ